MTSAPAIGFEYRPSRYLPRLLWVMAVLALLAMVLAGLPLGLKAVLAVLVAASVFRAARRWQASPVLAAGWSSDAGWSLHLADHRDVPAKLASFRVLGGSIWLRLQTTGQGEQVLLLASDNSDADIRRRLRMRLAAMRAAPQG